MVQNNNNDTTAVRIIRAPLSHATLAHLLIVKHKTLMMTHTYISFVPAIHEVGGEMISCIVDCFVPLV